MTRLVLLNAVYFKGDWAEPFAAGSTRDEDFHLGGTEKVRVPMMSGTLKAARFGAFQKAGFHMLEMPYAGGELSMVLLVPDRLDGLAHVEKQMTAELLRGWIERLEMRAVEARVPKFTLRTDYDMQPTLEALGMRRAFKPGEADFTGMVESGERLCLGQVRQRAFVEVNEKGTEAAAVSAVEAVSLSMAPRPAVPVFSADRPFVFLIRDRKTGTILFVGRVADPRKE
jgi:serpin B